MPPLGNIEHAFTDRLDLLEEDVCMLQSKGRGLLLGNFSTRVGKSNDVDDINGMFGDW